MLRTPGGKRRIPESEIRRVRGEALNLRLRVLAIYGREAKGDLDRQVVHIRAAMAGQGFDGRGLWSFRPAQEPPAAAGRNHRRGNNIQGPAQAVWQYFASYGVRLQVVDGQEDRKSLQEELLDDLPAIVTSFAGNRR